MQFYGKLTSNQSIGTETTQFLWAIDLPKYWKGNYAVLWEFTSNQRIGKETMQFLWEITF